jgi:hypothetical protein
MCLINCESSLAHKLNPTSGYILIKVHAHSYPFHYSLYCIFTRLRFLLISGHIYHLHAPKNSLGIVFVSLSSAFTYGLIYILGAFLSPNSAVTRNDVFSFTVSLASIISLTSRHDVCFALNMVTIRRF